MSEVMVFLAKHFRDDRGSFSEVFVESKMAQLGLPPVRQINVSYNKPNVVRGFHLQTRKPQGKYIRVLSGRATACLLDLRPEALTGAPRLIVVELSPDGQSIYVPPGYGNSFWTHEETIYLYGCTDEYDPGGETGVSPFDEEIDPPWKNADVILSEKDLKLPSLSQYRQSVLSKACI